MDRNIRHDLCNNLNSMLCILDFFESLDSKQDQEDTIHDLIKYLERLQKDIGLLKKSVSS